MDTFFFEGGHHKIGLVLGVISMYFRVFSYGKCTEWGYFWMLQIFQRFFFFFGGGGGA